MAFFESTKLADADKFQRRVLYALLTSSKNIMAEPANVTNHADRAAFAEKVINTPSQYVLSVSQIVTTNVAIDAVLNKETGAYETTASDPDIQFTVDSLFNALAGVST